MPGRSKKTTKASTTQNATTEPKNSGKFVLTRDAKTDSLNVFALTAIKSTKDQAELTVGDCITYSSGRKRTRATIILLGERLSSRNLSEQCSSWNSGSAEECEKSLNITERTEKVPSQQTTTATNFHVEDVVENDEHEEAPGGSCGENTSNDGRRNKEDQSGNLDHASDLDEHSEKENFKVNEVFLTLSSNRIPTSEPSK